MALSVGGKFFESRDETTSDYDREKLQERLAKLAGGVAAIRVGGSTEIEALNEAPRAATKEAAVPGECWCATLSVDVFVSGSVTTYCTLPVRFSLKRFTMGWPCKGEDIRANMTLAPVFRA